MRKIISILLILTLILSETGVSFAMHFCGDKLVFAQLNMGQDNGGCDMDNSDCESTNSTIIKSNCCVNSVVSIEQTNSYELFTFNWLIIRIPVSRYQWEQVYSYDSLEDLQFEFIESPPTLRKNLIRSYLQVYVI